MARARRNFGRTAEVLPLPDLLSFQQSSFRWVIDRGIKDALDEFSPMTDNRTLALHLVGYRVDEPAQSIDTCREQDGTYAGRFFVTARLQRHETGEMLAEQEIYVCELPMMTAAGTFIVNGNEKTVVSQLTRSPGAYFSIDRDSAPGTPLGCALLIPHRGAWLELETRANWAVRVRADKKAPLPVTTFFRALGFSVEALKEVFLAVDPSKRSWDATVARDTITSQQQALLEFHRKIRAGEVPTLDSSKTLVETMFFNPRRYSLGRVGRYMLDRRLGLGAPLDQTLLSENDLLAVVRRVLEVSTGQARPDDMDHLGNRRVRGVGELLQQQIRLGLAKTERNVRSKMNTLNIEDPKPEDVLNVRSLAGSIKELFVSSGLAPQLDQTNMLDEITHKRKLSALGPGGLNRERAGMKERDVHPSHYGRLCPIETPEGQNVGLITSLALYGRINDYGFIETPYRRVVQEDGRSRATDEIVYLTADAEERFTIAQANTRLDERGHLVDPTVEARLAANPVFVPSNAVELMDVSPKQIVSAAAALIPFLEHDDGSRALMGANMQRQAVPLVRAEAPLIGTGLEAHIARNSGHVLFAERAGTVETADDRRIVVRAEGGQADAYPLVRFERTNATTMLTHRVRVRAGQRVAVGDLLADTTASADGELALGRNLLVCFAPFDGLNFEDAIVISERVVKEDLLNSVHIDTFECKAVSTKLGLEEITRDLPNADTAAIADLDENGVVRIGARVVPGAVLVGKITPKSEGDPSPEERLLRAIFGEKAKEVRDTSLRLPHGEKGEVINVQVYTPKNHPNLPAGTKKMVRVTIAIERKVSVGDKLAGRHGNKGVVSRILPVADMPVLPDGTPVDVILNPLGVPSRMNVGQLLETHLGWAAGQLGQPMATPIFDGAREEDIQQMLSAAGLPSTGKIALRDGRTGELFDSPVTVGYMYILKLHHLVDEKIHARSTGPYTLVTQQPLGGKAQFGGQRFGEMEVWALEGHGAATNLLELLTVKSDDQAGRINAYWAILNGQEIRPSGITESFKVLVKELQALGLDIQALDASGKPVEFTVRAAPTADAATAFRELGASHRFEG